MRRALRYFRWFFLFGLLSILVFLMIFAISVGGDLQLEAGISTTSPLRFLLPSPLRSLPEIESCAAGYIVKIPRDGTKPPGYIANFQSHARAEILLPAYQNYLQTIGCDQVSEATVPPLAGLRLKCQSPTFALVSLWIESQTPCNLVRLEFITLD